jgi:hypothetical protein
MTHTSTEQAEALRLADIVERLNVGVHSQAIAEEYSSAAACLRAQHARIAELEQRLEIDHRHRYDGISARDATIEAQDERIAELESQLDAIGAGGVEPLRKQVAAPQAVQAEVPEAIEQMAVDRYKVVPSHESMFHRWAVVAGGTQQLYIGREVECLNMARKFAGAFLDGAFVAMQNTTPAHPAEGVPQAITDEREAFVNWLHGTYPNSYSIIQAADLWFHKHVAALAWKARAALAATHPTQQGLDAQGCDMFWVADDPDGQHDTLHDAVVRAFEDGGIDADGCVEIQCAKSIPNIVVRITGTEPFAFKVIPDSELAAQAKQGGF